MKPFLGPDNESLKLHFFDLEITIQSDSALYLDLFERMYRRFRKRDSRVPVRSSAELILLTTADNPWQKPVMCLDGEVWPLRPEGMTAFVNVSLFNTIVRRVRSHFLIHAGVVSTADQGVIIVADSRHGKTTLVLELVRRGFHFLSDESAALGREDRCVHPFPRTLGVRPGTLKLAGFADVPLEPWPWLGKSLLDIEELQPDSLGQAVPLTHLIILRDPAKKEVEKKRDQRFTIFIDRPDEALLQAIQQIEGISEVQLDRHGDDPIIRFRLRHRSQHQVLSDIERLCQARRVWLLAILKGTGASPSFDKPARLEALSSSQATMTLLEQFQGGYNSAIFQEELGGNPTRLFMVLAGLIAQATCYQLSVGPLSEMADLVSDVIEIDR